MELQCGICLVRTWRKSDAAPIARHANDREVWLNLRDLFPHPYNTSHAVAYIRSVTAQTPPSSFVIVVADEPVGGIALRLGEDIERCSAEIGYWLGRAYWGRGIMTAAVGAVTAYGFASLDLLRVFALPFTDNAASVRVLEKAGYVREGLLRSSAIKAGKVRDQYLYAAVRASASHGLAPVGVSPAP
jgi:[ribosomal protein S5]-alanine N-acetyltransferase